MSRIQIEYIEDADPYQAYKKASDFVKEQQRGRYEIETESLTPNGPGRIMFVAKVFRVN